jgi:hypothetical protein
MLQKATDPKSGVSYGFISKKSRNNPNTYDLPQKMIFFPRDWSEDEVIEAIERPDTQLFRSMHKGRDTQYVSSRGVPFIRVFGDDGRIITAYPAMSEQPGASVPKLKKLAMKAYQELSPTMTD